MLFVRAKRDAFDQAVLMLCLPLSSILFTLPYWHWLEATTSTLPRRHTHVYHYLRCGCGRRGVDGGHAEVVACALSGHCCLSLTSCPFASKLSPLAGRQPRLVVRTFAPTLSTKIASRSRQAHSTQKTHSFTNSSLDASSHLRLVANTRLRNGLKHSVSLCSVNW